MPVYVALLRGVNLGPNKRMKMEKLRESFNGLGLDQVQTYIQSGNVVFKAARVSQAALCRKLEAAIIADFGFSSSVITRTQEEIGQAIETNPFVKKSGIDLTRLHVTFLAVAPEASVLEELKGLTKPPDESICQGREIFLHLPNGMAKSSLTNNPLERRLLKISTTRNWNTVSQLYKMCQACR
jgi:uncharacterized protein (DUF1697 family)